jgi:hypothetical protein
MRIFNFFRHHKVNQEQADFALPNESVLQKFKVSRRKHTLIDKAQSLLTRRRIHQHNLGLLEEQLASSQLPLTPDQLQAVLQAPLESEQQKIAYLEAKPHLRPHEQNLLANHRRNLEYFHQMLNGERPYAPLHLLNQIQELKKEILQIDANLAELFESPQE